MKTNFKGFVSLREPAKSKNKQTKKTPTIILTFIH